jgi:hypothetical protein
MGTLVEPLFNPYSRVGIWVNAINLSGVSLGWAEWEKRRHEWEVNKNLFITNIYTKIYLSWVVLSQPSIHHSYFGPNMEIKMFLKLGFYHIKNLIVLYIVAFVGEGLIVHID